MRSPDAPGGAPTPEDEFAELLREFGPALRRLAAAYTRSAADQDDLFQEIVFALWGALPRFRGEASQRTYVYRVAHNRGISWRSRRRPPVEPIDHHHQPADPARTAEQQLIRDEAFDRLLRVVRDLSDPLRQVVLLQLEGLEAGEIAEVLGVSTNVVHVRAHRARETLRALLGREQRK